MAIKMTNNYMNNMKVVILAGGYGTRIAEESSVRPKPMVEIGGKPILWHIMKIFSVHGFNNFIICAGYKGHIIKEYLSNNYKNSDLNLSFNNDKVEVINDGVDIWKVMVADTGEKTMTGGRLKKIKKYLGDKPFFLTYGDGVADVDLKELLKFHKSMGVLATVTAVQPEGRWGILNLSKGQGIVKSFREKPKNGGSWINGGFFVLDPRVIDYIKNDDTVFEQEPMMRLVEDGQLAAFRHKGFWMCMDTLRDKNVLEDLWQKGKALWKIWKE